MYWRQGQRSRAAEDFSNLAELLKGRNFVEDSADFYPRLAKSLLSLCVHAEKYRTHNTQYWKSKNVDVAPETGSLIRFSRKEFRTWRWNSEWRRILNKAYHVETDPGTWPHGTLASAHHKFIGTGEKRPLASGIIYWGLSSPHALVENRTRDHLKPDHLKQTLFKEILKKLPLFGLIN